MLCLDAQPNAAHRKLAEWERQGKLKAVVTQNIDLVENHVRLDDSATGAPGYALAALNRFHTVERAAPGTVVAPDAAMELQDIFAKL